MLIVRYILLQPEVEGDISFATNRGHFISLLQCFKFSLTLLYTWCYNKNILERSSKWEKSKHAALCKREERVAEGKRAPSTPI